MSIRGELLDEAKRLIDGDRTNQYGPPTQDFDRTAAVLSALGFRHVNPKGEPVELASYHVAEIMMALKLSRISWQPEKRDSWVDTAGYAGCGWETVVATLETGRAAQVVEDLKEDAAALLDFMEKMQAKKLPKPTGDVPDGYVVGTEPATNTLIYKFPVTNNP